MLGGWVDGGEFLVWLVGGGCEYGWACEVSGFLRDEGRGRWALGVGRPEDLPSRRRDRSVSMNESMIGFGIGLPWLMAIRWDWILDIGYMIYDSRVKSEVERRADKWPSRVESNQETNPDMIPAGVREGRNVFEVPNYIIVKNSVTCNGVQSTGW